MREKWQNYFRIFLEKHLSSFTPAGKKTTLRSETPLANYQRLPLSVRNAIERAALADYINTGGNPKSPESAVSFSFQKTDNQTSPSLVWEISYRYVRNSDGSIEKWLVTNDEHPLDANQNP